MLRNDLIILLSQGDNDPVTVDMNGERLDIATVKADQGGTVILLQNEEDLTAPIQDDGPA